MHGRALAYCDFKPDNVIQVGDDVKLIDLGGVRHLDDPTGDIYGTVGFQAPEIAEMGPSIASDLYTIGRTLAVLTLDFRGYQTTYEHSLPDPADHPALSRFASFHRFLLKATAPHPDDRFQSTPELADQLIGVMREVVALTTGEPQPGPSNVFGGVPSDAGSPVAAGRPGRPGGRLPGQPGAGRPGGRARGHRRGGARPSRSTRPSSCGSGGPGPIWSSTTASAVRADIAAVEADDPWDWRAVWLRGVLALNDG